MENVYMGNRGAAGCTIFDTVRRKVIQRPWFVSYVLHKNRNSTEGRRTRQRELSQRI